MNKTYGNDDGGNDVAQPPNRPLEPNIQNLPNKANFWRLLLRIALLNENNIQFSENQISQLLKT